jgi:hypothetical protein
MEAHRFDRLARSLGRAAMRRRLLIGLALSPLAGLVAIRNSEDVEARKRRKKKRKPRMKPRTAEPNEFGCLSVGDPCYGAEQCCSGVCSGKKGKRTCRAHGTGTCNQEAPGVCEEGPTPTVLCNGGSCWCLHTTAGSTFCGNTGAPSNCADCQKDADCEELGFPSGSACVLYSGIYCSGCGEGAMACVAPCDVEPAEPT